MKIKKKIKKHSLTLLLLIQLAVLYDIFLITSVSDVRFYGAILTYLIITLISKFSSKITFIFCILLLIFLYVRYLFVGPDVGSEEIAVWLVLFFVVGILQKIRE